MTQYDNSGRQTALIPQVFVFSLPYGCLVTLLDDFCVPDVFGVWPLQSVLHCFSAVSEGLGTSSRTAGPRFAEGGLCLSPGALQGSDERFTALP